MIITKMGGALGNQLFEYALGRCLAHKHNTELKIDITEVEKYKDSHHNNYVLNNFNVEENFATPEEIDSLPSINEGKLGKYFAFAPEILDSPDNIHLDGLWQSGKYFEDAAVSEILRREFTLKNPLGKNSASWEKKILAADCPVSLHVRHGDYLMPIFRNHAGIIPLKYYFTCVSELKKFFPQMTLFVFSDDLDWVKENLKLDVPTEFVESCEKDFEELYLMSLCKHNIIANSTFSWWAAWLNKNPDKKVFTPYPWHRDGHGKDTVVPDNWIKIPVNYERNRPFSPLLSIIVCVGNDAATISLTISSILSQSLRDFELIIVDTSEDGSGDFCRRFAKEDNVTFLKSNGFEGKLSAWNKGLECARGDYVLFVTGKDFLIIHTVALAAIILDEDFREKCLNNKREEYLTYKKYAKKKSPNIIFSTQEIKEDATGNISIEGVADKKFSIKTDEPFKNLNGFTEIKIDDAQKLMLLGSQQINNSLGTKFFKRGFLNEHNIRFDETLKGGGTAELKFLAEAILATENIVFAPSAFYGRLK